MGNVLWVGYWADGLYKYTSLDTAGTIVPNPTPEGLRLPVDVYGVLAWRNKLFVGGYWPGTPIVHDPVANTWKYIGDNFCKDKYGKWTCEYVTTWKFAATKDTLYAASGAKAFKIGWSDIP